MGSLAHMDNDEYYDVSGGRYSHSIAISMFLSQKGGRGHLNNTAGVFFMVAGK